MKTPNDVKFDLLQYAALHNIDSGVFMQGMAETVATIAHVLDQQGMPCHIDDRLSTLSDHIKAEYAKLGRAILSSRPLEDLVTM